MFRSYADLSSFVPSMRKFFPEGAATTPLGKSVVAPGMMYFADIEAAKGVAKAIAEASLLTKFYDVQQMKQLLNPPRDHSFGNMWELYNDMALLFVVHQKHPHLLRFLPVLPKSEPG